MLSCVHCVVTNCISYIVYIIRLHIESVIHKALPPYYSNEDDTSLTSIDRYLHFIHLMKYSSIFLAKLGAIYIARLV